MRKLEPPKNARLAILCAGVTLMASVIATQSAAPPAPPRNPTGGATLCGANPFCLHPANRGGYVLSGVAQ